MPAHAGSGKEPDAAPGSASDRPAFVIRLDGEFYGVAVWLRDERGTPVYEIRHRGIRVLKLAATLAAHESGTMTQE